jgi:SAM-dependent methyltransferase
MTININLDKNYWASRYQQDQTGWDIGFCSTPLKEYFDQLTNKELKILIPGAGYAHEAKYLHELGFSQVYVIDLAQEPLTHLKEICPDFPEEHLLLGDFFEHKGEYDLIVEQTFFCAIDPSLREAYVQKMKTLLKPLGKLVGVLFNRDFEGGPPFGGCVEDYRALFEKYFDSVSMETCYNSIEPRKGSEVFMKVS